MEAKRLPVARTGNLRPRKTNQWPSQRPHTYVKRFSFHASDQSVGPLPLLENACLYSIATLKVTHTDQDPNRGKDYWASQWTDEPSSQPKAHLPFSVAPTLDQAPDLGTVFITRRSHWDKQITTHRNPAYSTGTSTVERQETFANHGMVSKTFAELFWTFAELLLNLFLNLFCMKFNELLWILKCIWNVLYWFLCIYYYYVLYWFCYEFWLIS